MVRAGSLIGGRPRPAHAVTVWRRDHAGTRWAWSCVCGTRYRDDLPDHDSASAQARAHENAARNAATESARTA